MGIPSALSIKIKTYSLVSETLFINEYLILLWDLLVFKIISFSSRDKVVSISKVSLLLSLNLFE
ncbi:hypothetical protein D3C81_1243140 [compost metagenome]